MTKQTRKQFPLYIDPKLFDKLKKKAEKEHKLVSPKIVELIMEYVNNGTR